MSGMGILWAITAVVVPTLVAAGMALAMEGVQVGEFIVARFLIIGAAVVLGGVTLYWLLITDLPLLLRLTIGALVGSVIFVSIPESMRWISARFAHQKAINEAQAVVPVTQFHGGIHFHISPQIARAVTDSVKEAVSATDAPPARPLIEAPKYLGVFEAEADGMQPALLVGPWNKIQFQRKVLDPEFDYNEKTGIYTVDKAGIYQFDLLIDFNRLDKTAAAMCHA